MTYVFFFFLTLTAHKQINGQNFLFCNASAVSSCISVPSSTTSDLPLLPCLLPPLPTLARLHSEYDGDDADAMLHDVMRLGLCFPPLTSQPLTVVFDMF